MHNALCNVHNALCYVSGLEAEEDRQAGRGKEAEQAAMYDGMEILSTPPAKLRFGRDLRLLEVSTAATPMQEHLISHVTLKIRFVHLHTSPVSITTLLVSCILLELHSKNTE